MIAKRDRNQQRLRRHRRVRGKISGTAARPRLCVYRSNKNIYAQIIDDVKGVTLACTSSLDPKFKAENAKPNMAGAVLLGKLAAEAAKAANVTEVVFDRSGYNYHGRMKAIAETARENGLKF